MGLTYPDLYAKLVALKGTRTNQGDRQGNSKYSNYQIEETFKLLCANPLMPNKEIADITGVSKAVVASITSMNNYSWLQDKYPEEFHMLADQLDTKRQFSRSAKARGIIYPPIVSPLDGSVHIVENVSKFAREHGLDTGQLNKVLNKKANSTKGWKLQ